VKNVKKYLPSAKTLSFLAVMLACYAIFSVLQPAYIKSPYSILVSSTLPAALALSMGVVIAGGGFDLSIGHVAGFSTLMCGYFLRRTGMDTYAAISCAVGLSILIGAINGMMVAKFGISSFIATLSMQFVLVGARQLITSGDSFRANAAIRNIVQGRNFGISNLIIVSLTIIVIVGFVMQKTAFGRKMQFVGSNITASRFMGINVKAYTFLAFLISGAISGVVGILQFSKLTSATINIGDGWLFGAMTIAVFSSVIFGRFKAHGIIIVSFLITMITTGINMLGVSSAWTNFTLGVILIISLLAGKYLGVDSFRALRKRFSKNRTV
jgi:ribose transport system permease protein